MSPYDEKRPRRPSSLLRTILLYCALIAIVFFLELSVFFAVISRNLMGFTQPGNNSDIDMVNDRVVVSLAHEAAGRFPLEAWYENCSSHRLLGFGLHLGAFKRSPAEASITMLAIPLWFIALLLFVAMIWLSRMLGMRFHRWRLPVRGFEPIMTPSPVTPPPPTAHTAESGSSSPPR